MSKIEHEKRTIARMVGIYCRHCEGNPELCADCAALIDYACTRLDRCPHGNAKPSCRKCSIHCYSPAMRQRVRRVMRFSGPRMLIYGPADWLRHLFD